MGLQASSSLQGFLPYIPIIHGVTKDSLYDLRTCSVAVQHTGIPFIVIVCAYVALYPFQRVGLDLQGDE